MSPSAKELWEAGKASAIETPKLSQDELDQVSNRSLKQKYAYWFIGILICQLVVMNLIFFFVGLGVLHFDQVTINIYTTSTILEVFGVVFVIVNNLFPTGKK